MKKSYWLRSLTLLCAGMFAAGAASAQNLKIGVVDLARLIDDSPQAERAEQSMESQFLARKEELQARAETLRQDVERLDRDGAVMSDETRTELENAIRDQQRQLQMRQGKYNDDVAQAEQNEFAELRDVIRQAIAAFADAQNYDLILGDSVLHATDAVDVTDEVLARLQTL